MFSRILAQDLHTSSGRGCLARMGDGVMKRELCKAACEYIDYGFTVYPLNEQNTPLLFKWNTANAIRDHDRAEEVFLNDPKGKAHGVGIVCGVSGITPVDVDPKNGGDMTFRRLVYGCRL